MSLTKGKLMALHMYLVIYALLEPDLHSILYMYIPCVYSRPSLLEKLFVAKNMSQVLRFLKV